MTDATFAHRCGVHTGERERAVQACWAQMEQWGVDQVRFVWCDVHGTTRTKTLMLPAARRALMEGVGMVSTLMLKDTSDRTAFQVFEPSGTDDLPGFAQGNNVSLLPDPQSLQRLPWAKRTAWLRCDTWFEDGTPVPFDTRRVLQTALTRLAAHGWGMRCGLEVEFHIYRMRDQTARLSPQLAAWPGLPPELELIHPGFALLSEAWADMADDALRIVQDTAQGLGMPLLSLEIELGPSQVEAVFEATDAITAADTMVLFRSAVRQALARHGYWASFVCRPPFEAIMSSGWHLHQSLVDLSSGRNVFQRDAAPSGVDPLSAQTTLSNTGCAYLAGLLTHARGSSVFGTPTINGYGRYRPNALAPQSAVWGRDNRGAMLRVIGACGDSSTRIENRVGEPAANPYLYMAAQIHAGLDGVTNAWVPPLATQSPYGAGHLALPTQLDQALDALRADDYLVQSFSPAFVDYLCRIKGMEWQRYQAAADPVDFQIREYFSRL